MNDPSNGHPIKTAFAVIFILLGVLVFAGSGLCTLNVYEPSLGPSEAGLNDLFVVVGLITMTLGFVVALVGWLMWRSAHKRRS